MLACDPPKPGNPGKPGASDSDGETGGDGDGDGETGDGETDGDGDCEPDCTITDGPKRLAVGGRHTCVLQFDGDVHCWGENRWGQLGLGHTVDIGDDELPNAAGPVPLPAPAVDLAAGRFHTCALLEGGALICWGLNTYGQLGRGDMAFIGNDELPSLDGAVDLGAPVLSVHAGPLTTCAITSDHELFCWGYNGVSKSLLGYASPENIGDDEPPSAAGPVDVGGPVLEVAIGSGHMCALLDGGDVRCWGTGGPALGADHGQAIGDDEFPSAVEPIELGGPAVAVAAGWTHACALLDGGEVRCWGSGTSGALGYGDFASVTVPNTAGPVALGDEAIAIGLGLSHSCAVTRDGSAFCWGDEGNGRLGYPGVEGWIGGELEPIDVGPLDLPGPVLEIAGGDAHTCARVGLEVYCWGAGWAGQTGYATTASIGDDEPPASFGPVQYTGGEGNGVGPIEIKDEFEGDDPNVALRLRLAEGPPPSELDPGELIQIRGTWWNAVDCEDCGNSFVVTTAEDQTVILASIAEREDLHPPLGILAMFGWSVADFTAPLQLSLSELGLCDPIYDPYGICDGDLQRLALAVDSPTDPPAVLLDGSQGHGGGGYQVTVGALVDWTGECDGYAVDTQPIRRVLMVRQDCAPDCGPVTVADACAPADGNLDTATLLFGSKQPSEIGYELTCLILDQVLLNGQWQHDLECLGLPW
jgi:alpha-tubulin suppressor-like RCC1 family protein